MIPQMIKGFRRALARVVAAAVLLTGVLFAMPSAAPGGSVATATAGGPLCHVYAAYPEAAVHLARAGVSVDCPSVQHIQAQTCLYQLVTGGWRKVVGSCNTSSLVFARAKAIYGKTYPATCDRFYKTWAWGYVRGATPSAVSGWSGSWKGCT